MSLLEETASGKNHGCDLFIKSVGIERKIENREKERKKERMRRWKAEDKWEIIVKGVLPQSICLYIIVEYNGM